MTGTRRGMAIVRVPTKGETGHEECAAVPMEEPQPQPWWHAGSTIKKVNSLSKCNTGTACVQDPLRSNQGGDLDRCDEMKTKDEVPICFGNSRLREYDSGYEACKPLNFITDIDKAAAQAPATYGRKRRHARERKAMQDIRTSDDVLPSYGSSGSHAEYDTRAAMVHASNGTTLLRWTTAARTRAACGRSADEWSCTRCAKNETRTRRRLRVAVTTGRDVYNRGAATGHVESRTTSLDETAAQARAAHGRRRRRSHARLGLDAQDARKDVEAAHKRCPIVVYLGGPNQQRGDVLSGPTGGRVARNLRSKLQSRNSRDGPMAPAQDDGWGRVQIVSTRHLCLGFHSGRLANSEVDGSLMDVLLPGRKAGLIGCPIIPPEFSQNLVLLNRKQNGLAQRSRQWLSSLLEKKASHQSGNGWKPSVWPDIVKAMAAANPGTEPQKDMTVKSKLEYMRLGPAYIFVAKFSGTGWDAEDNTQQIYIKDFIPTHGKKYAQCFKIPCPYYIELDTLFDGMKNHATGEHVIHLGCKQSKQLKRSNDSNKENLPQQDTSATTPLLTDTNPRTPMVDLTAMTNKEVEAGLGTGEPYNDELSLVCR
ncbi:hypothetical protein DFH07DRAFT_763721 [Mycena maculata]|uniref:Uncharacterized protein n=1 Tax=Mycena maculata TaxID=230809 RepID=A0AAD7KGH0_9AGAR|nr:hypothetical protein DFH07DRAFT_763721 [Mycena maculata]